ncbi:flagellar basal-body rod protein FlgF [Rhodovulum iodosum]|uniref:Flagellar basal-body rod protein FlgF n=1 Tax=Rhodovulum iodosum TaxID=68291 RepID=A0ABV3XS61_9RHOB|nr:flagellar hook-basal body complex protein [Rhodovulum robiginosum]RSK40022.1 flagellar hook-basal body complex protein [Rhodovulum robiginosum]
MDGAGYIALSRQAGLMRALDTVAQNIANAATTGYRREGVIFSEHVVAQPGGGALAMANGHVRRTDFTQAPLRQTDGPLDFAIEGTGFFLVETPRGQRLTRAGHFTPEANGELVTPAGHRLLDAGGAPVFVPPDAAGVALAPDGTLSADGRALTRIGLYAPADPTAMRRAPGAAFDPGGAVQPLEEARLMQGFLEESNVEPVAEIARMIDVQHAYELGQSLIDREDERIRSVIRTLGA